MPRLTQSRADTIAIGSLAAAVFVFLLPALTLQAPASYCDSPVESVPRAMAIARVVQDGGLPLWDFNTFAGARPFYVTNESAIFYPVMYPFYLLADLEDVRQATVMLILLPFVLHVMFAAVGGYAFGRWGLRLHPGGAATTGLVWALSPEFGLQIITPDVGFLFSYLPWIALATTRYLDVGTTRWWLWGSVFLALMNSCGTANFVIRVYFVSAAACFLYWLLSWRSAREPAHGAWMRLAGIAGMFLTAIAINAFAWAGILEGILWLEGAVEISYESASDMWAESSMPPIYLITLFFPNFFGVLDNQHGWGIALSEGITNLSAMSSGIGIVVAIAACLTAAVTGPADRDEHGQRRWTWVAGILLVATLFTMMGRYTPVFGWFCTLLPPFFRIPHAVYYRFAECWAVAVLAGIAVSSLLTRPSFRASSGHAGIVAFAVFTGVLCAWIGLEFGAEGLDESDPAYVHLTEFDEWSWFLAEPIAQFAVFSLALLAAFLFLPAARRGWALLAIIAVETVTYAVPVFYETMLFEQTRPEPERRVVIQDERYLTMADHPHFAAASPVGARPDASAYRFVGYNSRVDNQAWTRDLRALFGYSSKPLLPRFRHAVDEVATGGPYDLMLLSQTEPARVAENLTGLAFFRNMNARWVLGDLGQPPTWMNQTHALSLVEIEEPLPYAYLQDRIAIQSDEAQLEQLVRGDLREHAGISDVEIQRDPRIRADLDGTGFAGLQSTTPIRGVVQRPNRTELDIDVPQSALLVLSEAWHPGWSAWVNGQPAPVLRVNYVQQGIWLEAGRQDVLLRFFPSHLRIGGAISAAALTLCAWIAWRLRRLPAVARI